MASKRNNARCGSAEKRKRKTIDLGMKMKIIVEYENGKSVSTIARDLSLSHSTISTILKDKGRILEAVSGSAPLKATIITKKRQGPIHEMERLLVAWLQDLIKRRIPLDLVTIQTKARSIFETLKERAGDEYVQTFIASHGWFQRFKNRFNLQGVPVSGEAASYDVDSAQAFKEELDRLFIGEKYIPERAADYIHEDASSLHSDASVLVDDGNDSSSAPQAGASSHVNSPVTSPRSLQGKKRKRDGPDSAAELARCMRDSDDKYMEFLRREMQAERELRERHVTMEHAQRRREAEAAAALNRELLSFLKQLGHALLARSAGDLPLD